MGGRVVTTPSPVSTRLVLRQRLENQLLADAGAALEVDAVARHMLAMQGQDLPGLLWALALRAGPETTEASTRAAFDERRVVRSWPIRGTLHAVAAEDLGWMLSLTGDRMIRSAAGRRRQLGLSETDVARASDLIDDALGDGGALSRAELVSVLDRAGLDPVGQRVAHILYHAAHRGVICLGPIAGKEQLFVSYRAWVPNRRQLDRDEALAELARRYLGSHGPASETDLAWWAGITVNDVRRGIAALGSTVERLTAGGDAADLLVVEGSRRALDETTGVRSPVVLAPGFDETLLGYRERSHALKPEHAPRIVPGGNGMFLPTIQHGGTVVGLWRRAERGRRIELTPEPFQPLTKTVLGGVERAARRYGVFRGMPVTVTAPLP